MNFFFFTKAMNKFNVEGQELEWRWGSPGSQSPDGFPKQDIRSGHPLTSERPHYRRTIVDFIMSGDWYCP